MRLNLFGVVLAGDRSIADLKDPGSKRVYAYRLGDSVAGGTIWAIESSHIVLERRNPRLEVQLLHDPSRPKPSGPVVVASAEGFETAARPVATDSRTDTMSSATLSTPLAARATGRSAARYQLRHRGARRSTGPMSTIRGVTLIDGVLPL